eukprot:1056247-Rhodomonas_salina.3
MVDVKDEDKWTDLAPRKRERWMSRSPRDRVTDPVQAQNPTRGPQYTPPRQSAHEARASCSDSC